MNRENPYNEERDEFGVIKRTFYETTDSDEFVWHKDKKDRLVTPVTETDWMIQFDNELPRKMVIGESIEIPKESYHRVIKGSGDLIVEIIETTFEPDEYDILGEGEKKKSGKKDACYYKVKSRYDVWPSAYGSGALVQCRKVGAKNWGNKTKEGLEENKQEFQDRALDKINKVGGFDKLSDIDKLALLGGTNDGRLMSLDLNKIFKENGGTFGQLEVKIKVKDINQQPINHKFSKEFAGKEGYLYPYINYTENGEPYIKVRFDEFISNPDYKGGGSYEERPIFLANIYPIDYDEIKSDFVKYQNNVDQDRSDFLSQFGLDGIDERGLEVYEAKKTDFSKEKSKGLHGWFERRGGKGKSKGWVDCNTCRTDKKTGRKKCKPCGRKEGEERSKYPACRPTPSACGTKGKGKKWGKKSVNENVDKQTINSFLSDFGFFITLNLTKVQSEAKNDDAKNKLAKMQSNLNKFSKNYTELIDPTKNKNLYEPKVLSQIIGQIGKYINYIKPHIETLVKDSDIKNAWLQKIQKLSNMYSTIIGKPNENRVHLIKNMLNENSEMLDVVEVFSIYNSNSVHTVEPDVKPVDVPTKPVEKPKTDSPYAPSIRPNTKPKAIK